MQHLKRQHLTIKKRQQVSKQKGQIIVLGVVFICVVLLLTLVLFNTTQNEYAKQNTTNSVDASVYSGLQYQARSLNYLAYTNRAIIANHVAVGQIVSTSAWLDYVQDSSIRMGQILQLIPVVGTVLSTGATAVGISARQIITTLPPLINGTQVAITGLQASQKTVRATTMLQTGQMVRRVLAQNDQRYTISPLGYAWLLSNANQWIKLTKNFTSEASLDRQAATISASLGRWSTQRHRSSRLAPLLRFEKRGTTKFVKVITKNGKPKWVWQGRDAASFVMKKIRTWRVVDVEIPIPTSKSHASANDPIGGRWLDSVPISERYARMNTKEIKSIYNGLSSVIALNTSNSQDPNVSIKLALEVNLPTSTVRTSSTAGIASTTQPSAGSGQSAHIENSWFNLTNQPTKNISSVSKGELYFSRAYDREDGAVEYANLFNPFWTVRLITSDSEKRQAWLSRRLIRPF